ncbi:MAG: dihydrolipoyl dehydrogenase [Candidatus Margulisbacteria bacterium]|nr:dihydrolipoyl dehydrogenase [Candidatus Margulisiibacteriota bacterium]
MSDKFDIAVLGGGPGGYAAAIRATQLGAKVALIEKDKLGGVCLNRGCIPTKAIIACTSLYEKVQKAESFGISTGEPTIDLAKVIERKNTLVAKIVKNLQGLIEKNKIEIITGTGQVERPGSIKVGNRDVQSRAIIIATGSVPSCLPGLSFDQEKFLCSDDALELKDVPKQITIVGGGVIGIHFAAIYSTLGSEVTIYEALPEILTGIDEEVVALVKRILNRKRVKILTGTLFDPAKAEGKTLICVGRTPNIMGLEALNLKMNKRSVWVSEKMETSVKDVYAAGDVCSQTMLAHVAYEQGVIAVENALGGSKTFDYDCIPIGIYTNPEIGAIGLTEKAAREKGINVKIGKFPFGALGIAQAMGEIEGFVKFVCDEKDNILGAHIIGPEATSLVGTAALAIKNKLTVEQVADTFQSHPSYPEGLQEAAEAVLKRALHILN